ncbi:excisionase family DNA-binding protein [Bacillus sp. FJAT-45037]|uniref:excisionase family DNA-binding protein n=1 Tax=Bacillus sp. FJAT-45037 TaxID=2011007 RepID=UPI000C23AF97|nr:excisionase family DNA-binding protein [Bacillus sp. FJAT-45037]
MYVDIAELAEYLGVSPRYIEEQIRCGNLKAVYDGECYFLNKEQFHWHREQLELKRKQISAELLEPIPEDWDAKDED